MSAIGYVKQQQDGSYKGNLDLLRYRGPLDILPNTNRTGDQPHFRLFSRASEVGAAWIMKNQQNEDFVSISLAHPAFGPDKIYANLGRAANQEDKDVMALIWNPRS
jgi:uncharacterized protein (DUF736 family)